MSSSAAPDRAKRVRVGLFLGMGPIAGAHFHRKFEESFVGLTDYEHPTVLSYSNPTPPRRLPEDGRLPPDPSPALLEGMDFFRDQRVDFVLAPCNTLMYYREALQRHSGIPIADIVGEVAAAVYQEYPDVRRIGLLSTADTAGWGLYHEALRSLLPDAEILDLDEAHQGQIEEVIEEIKVALHTRSDAPRQRVARAVRFLMGRGAQIVIAGCTELPCALDAASFREVPLLDSSGILARAGAKMVRELRSTRES